MGWAIGGRYHSKQPPQEIHSKGLGYAGKQVSYLTHLEVIGNGIMTSHEEVNLRAEQMSEELGGHQVHKIYSATHGFALDILECVALMFGIRTHAVDVAVNEIRNCLSQVGPEGIVNLHVHSQFGLVADLAFKDLTHAELSQINVYTYGSAKMIDNPNLGSAVNYVSP